MLNFYLEVFYYFIVNKNFNNIQLMYRQNIIKISKTRFYFFKKISMHIYIIV